MRTMYVITHPQASHHVDKTVGGWCDSELTEDGKRDAALIAEAIRSLIPAGAAVDLYSSDMKRTVALAAAISDRLAAAVVEDSDLREKSYGEADGKPQTWLDARFVPPPIGGDRMGHFEGISGAETRRDLATRVYAAVDRALSGTGEHVVIVTHGFALTFVVAAWVGMPIESTGFINIRSSPGGITVLREDDYFHNRQIVSLNGVEHLLHGARPDVRAQLAARQRRWCRRQSARNDR